MWPELLGGLDPSQWSTALASMGVQPPAPAGVGMTSPEAGGVVNPSPWEPRPTMPGPGAPTGSPAGPPVQAGTLPPEQGPAGAQPQGPASGGGLVQALRGMAAPNVPQPQRIGTPSAPHPSSRLQGGELLALLQHMGMLRGAPQAAPYQLPSTLGAALGGR